MIGVHERDGSLRYAGTVKAELRPRRLTDLEKKTSELVQTDPQFYNLPPRERGRDFYWLEPELVVEASFLEWTPAGEVRHLVFQGMRADKPASAITEEPVVDVDEPESQPQCESTTRAKPGRSGAERWLSLG